MPLGLVSSGTPEWPGPLAVPESMGDSDEPGAELPGEPEGSGEFPGESISGTDGMEEPGGPESAAELEYLKQMLEQQRRTTLQAMQASSELERQLEETRTELSTAKGEVAKASKEYRAAPKGARQAFSNQAAEIATLRANLYQAEKQLAREHQIRETEAKQASRKVKELAVELAVVQAHSGGDRTGFWKRTGWRRVAGVASVAAVAVLGAIAYSQQSAPEPVRAEAAALPIAAASAPAPSATTIHRGPRPAESRTAPSDRAKGGEFSGALDQLDYALQAFPGVKPEEVLRAVYQKSKECALVWNEGHPSLLFGSGPIGVNSLAGTVAQCAKAVEQFR